MLTIKHEFGYTRTKLKESSESQMKTVDEILQEKEDELRKAEYLCKMLKEEQVRVYKANVCYPQFTESAIRKSVTWLAALKNGTINDEKLDRGKKYPEKESYEYINWLIGDMFKIKDAEVKSISFVGWHTVAYDIRFAHAGKEWEIRIPNVSNISVDDVSNYGIGVFKLTVWYYDDHVSSFLFNTFEEDEVAGLFETHKTKFLSEENNG